MNYNVNLWKGLQQLSRLTDQQWIVTNSAFDYGPSKVQIHFPNNIVNPFPFVPLRWTLGKQIIWHVMLIGIAVAHRSSSSRTVGTHTSFLFFKLWILRFLGPNTYFGKSSWMSKQDGQQANVSVPCHDEHRVHRLSAAVWGVLVESCSFPSTDMLHYLFWQRHAYCDSASNLLITPEAFLACFKKALQRLYIWLLCLKMPAVFSPVNSVWKWMRRHGSDYFKVAQSIQPCAKHSLFFFLTGKSKLLHMNYHILYYDITLKYTFF